MASLNLDGDYGGFYWDIDGLGNPFNTTYYKAAALAAAYQGDGISSLTYVERRVANSSRTQYYTPSYWRTAAPGTYTYYGYVQAANGKYYYCGADSVIVHREEVIPYYTVDTIGYNNFDVNWFDTSDYPYLRIYVRTTGGTTVYDQWKSTGGRDSYVTITGLSPGTTYVVNVAYNTSASASGSTWIGSQEVTTEALPTYTYLYRARIFVDGVLYDYTNGTTPATTVSTGYSFSLQEVRNMVSIPSHTSFSYATNGNSYCSYSNGYFTLSSSAKTNRAYMDLYYTTDTYSLSTSYYDTVSRNALSLSGGGTYEYGDSATIGATIRDSTLYEWDGWYDEDYDLVTTSRTLNVTVYSDRTFYARARRKTFNYSQSYSKNTTDSVTNMPPQQSGSSTDATFSFTVSAAVPVRTGYTFIGWNTRADGGGAWYSGGDAGPTLTHDSASVTLYAQWSIKQYSVQATYSPGYSAMFSSISVSPGTVDYGGSAVFTAVMQSGYSFVGWYDAGGNLVSTSRVYTVTGITQSFTLYARGQRNVFAASAQIGSGYSGMISSVSANPTTVNSGDTSTFTADLVSGYSFLGWYDANGNQVSTSNPYTATITEDTTLYARAYLTPFAWTYSHGAGTTSVSKAEWRRLQTFINRKRAAAGRSAYSFSAFKGYVTPKLFNEAAEAIGISDRVKHGGTVHKHHFTTLATAANNM